jgi:hypothetical protein
MTQPPDDAAPRPDEPGYWEQKASEQQPESPYGTPPAPGTPEQGAPPYPQYGAPPAYGGQPAYGAPQYGASQGGYGYGYGYGYAPPAKHPSATTAMVLGIIGLAGGMVCYLPILASPFAWWIGAKAVREIDASNGQMGGRGEANAGKITGIIGTVILLLGVLALVGVIALGVSGAFDDSGSSNV